MDIHFYTLTKRFEFIADIRFRNLTVAIILLACLALILSLPTIKPVRTVEIEPSKNNTGFQLSTNENIIAQNIKLNSNTIAYFIIWVREGKGTNHTVKAEEYRNAILEISSKNNTVRTATKAKFIKRNDRPALLFSFEPIKINTNDTYTFAVKNVGDIIVQQPLPAHLKEGEKALAAFQVGEKKNWLTLMIDKVYAVSLVGQDISFYLHRGQQIIQGQNPYSCVTDENESCVGFPAHLPGMYFVAAGFVAIGINNLETWAHVWRPVVFASWLGIGLLLLLYATRHKQPALGVAILGFWLFNRWSVDVLKIAHTDFIGTFFLILAVLLASSTPMLAALLLGISLAVKQLAALVVPLFLLVIWRQKNFGILKMFIILSLVLLIPLFVTLPFLIDNPQATMRGLFYVVERPAQSVRGFAPSLDEWLDITSGSKSIIMYFLVGTVYVAAWRKEINMVNGTLIVLAIMMAFTSTLYNQYFVWLLPFIPLAIIQARKRDKTEQSLTKTSFQ